MRHSPLVLAVVVCLFVASSHAECPKERDQRSNKQAGLLVSDFIITGTQALTSEQLATIRSELVGCCVNDDRDEIEERVRNIFQNKGYFGVEVATVEIKVNDPIARPKTVTVEADVKEGAQYRLGEISFMDNHAFSSSKLRAVFPLKTGEFFERSKIGGGLEALRNLYGKNGYLDLTAISDTAFGADQTINLTVTIGEGPQYRMGKLEIFASKEVADSLQESWLLPEGGIFDASYIDEFLKQNGAALPVDFARQNVRIVHNCPHALVTVRLFVDPTHVPQSLPQDIACESPASKE
jgi:outer membrane translocation and assembly module TamA